MSPAGRIAAGSYGAGLATRLYRSSPLRWYRKVYLDHRGLWPNDVFLASYPRSGSSWMRFLILEMTTGDASFERIRYEVPYVGWHAAARPLLPDAGRVIKTHEIYRLAYRARDPSRARSARRRDLVLRLHARLQKIRVRPGDDEEASFEHFLDAFLRRPRRCPRALAGTFAVVDRC